MQDLYLIRHHPHYNGEPVTGPNTELMMYSIRPDSALDKPAVTRTLPLLSYAYDKN